MPIVRYVVWVGTSLLALLFAANWFLPEPTREPGHEAINKPVIRIASIQQPPERVVIDTSQPTVVPPPPPFKCEGAGSPSSLQSYASVDPFPTVVDAAKKRPKAVERRGARVDNYDRRYRTPLRSLAAARRQLYRQPGYRSRRSFLDS